MQIGVNQEENSSGEASVVRTVLSSTERWHRSDQTSWAQKKSQASYYGKSDMFSVAWVCASESLLESACPFTLVNIIPVYYCRANSRPWLPWRLPRPAHLFAITHQRWNQRLKRFKTQCPRKIWKVQKLHICASGCVAPHQSELQDWKVMAALTLGWWWKLTRDRRDSPTDRICCVHLTQLHINCRSFVKANYCKSVVEVANSLSQTLEGTSVRESIRVVEL